MSLREKVKDALVGHHIQQIGSGHREIREIGNKYIGILDPCWNVMLCGTMSCLQDQTLWCEAELWVEHRGCLSSIKGVIL